jgi:GT2 family glycosyltransferase
LRDTINSHKGEKLGIVGFEGSGGVGPIGERVGFMSNLPNAEAHGSRIKEPYRFGAIMDGCAMFINRMLLEEMGGWDKGYFVHHIYDYDICMESLSRGYKNIILNIEFDHRSGMTATQMDFRTIEGKGEEWYMAHNTRRFQEKWVNPLNWDENLHPGTDISLEYQKYIERGKVYLPLVVNPWDGEVKWGYEK